MGTLHKRTHRPLAQRALMLSLFILLGVVGWQMPQLGSAVMGYSNQALDAARQAMTSAAAEKSVRAHSVKPAAAGTATGAALQLTPVQQQLAQAKAALAAARAAYKASPSKANAQALDAAQANYNAAAAARAAEIKTALNASKPSSEAAKTESGPVNSPSNYDALVSELQSLGGLPVLEAPAPVITPEVEPNNTAATAQTLTLTTQNVTIVSAAITAGDQDWFKFAAPANSKAYIYVDTGNNVSGQRDSQLTLFQPDGTTEIEFDDDGASGNGCDGVQETALASAISGANLTAAGTYVFKVNHFSAVGVIPAYKIFVVITPTGVASVTDTEPNDTPATGQTLLTAAQTVAVANGNVAGAAVDFYKLDLKAGNILYLSLDGDPERDGNNTDTDLSLRAPDGTTELFFADNTLGGTNAADPQSEVFCFLIPADGTYFVQVFGFTSSPASTSYRLLAAAGNSDAAGGGPQVCPPTPITSSLGVAGGNFPKVSGTMTQRLNRNGVVSACGVPRTQAAPIAGTFTFDKYSIVNTGGAPACITISLTVNEQTASNYMVGAFSPAFVPTNLTTGWLGDPGLSTGIPPSPLTFSVNVPAGANVDIVVFNTNATGDGNPYSLSVVGFPGCVAPPCGLTCPANITVSNAANQCGAVVTYPAPTTTGVCSTVTCTPASGSFFPKGTTTVTCTSPGNSNGTQSCSFTVTVNDTQPPSITCPANIFVGTTGTTQVVTYPLPVVSDNCPGVQTPVCTPASGTVFGLGTTTVTCTVQDAVNNSATCAFQVTVNKVLSPTLSDPLACTGPGNVISGSFSVTNSGGASATVAATVSLGPVPPAVPAPALLALTCTVSGSGTCTIVNATTISYTATLAAGASATISYQLQVGDLATPLTVLTSTVVASFNGGPPLTAGASLTVNCQPVGPGALYPARSEVSDQKAGSVLVYPVYTSAVGSTSQDSRISITNTHLNLRAWVHLFFVSDSCAVSDAFICLTPNQTSTFLASDLDPGTTGYLVAVASDGVTGCAINFNYLIGDAYVKFTSGHAANLGAEAISAIPGSPFFASCSANAVSSTLAFDGVSYNRLPYVLAVDNIGSRADGNDTIVVLDRIGGDLRTGPSGVGNIFGVFYNDTEALLSFTLNSSSCQYRFTVNNTTPRTTPRFEQFVTAGRTGWIKFYQRDGSALLGSVINFNPNAVTSAGAFSQGHNLHKLTLTDTASYIIPVFPPSC